MREKWVLKRGRAGGGDAQTVRDGGEKAEKWKGQIFLFLNEQINKWIH